MLSLPASRRALLPRRNHPHRLQVHQSEITIEVCDGRNHGTGRPLRPTDQLVSVAGGRVGVDALLLRLRVSGRLNLTDPTRDGSSHTDKLRLALGGATNGPMHAKDRRSARHFRSGSLFTCINFAAHIALFEPAMLNLNTNQQIAVAKRRRTRGATVKG
jgi:hypothetical protein